MRLKSLLLAIALVASIAASCGTGREPVAEGATPTAESPSHATFEADGELVVGSTIPDDRPLTLVVTLGRRLSSGSQLAIAFPTAVQEESAVLWSIPTIEPGVPGGFRL